MRYFKIRLRSRGPIVILLVSSLISIETWRGIKITGQLWGNHEVFSDQLRTEELARLLARRTEVESRLEDARLFKREETGALLRLLEGEFRQFEQSRTVK